MHPNTYRGKRCPYCRRIMEQYSRHLRPTRDHVIPRSRGGRECTVCCNKCNAIKGNMMPEEWYAFMDACPGWWLLTKRERRRRRTATKRDMVVVPPALIWSNHHGMHQEGVSHLVEGVGAPPAQVGQAVLLEGRAAGVSANDQEGS